MALEISGWVQNLSNGDVLAEGQGSEESINAWMNVLRNGPSMARVDELQTEWIDVMSLAGGFSIK